MATKVPWHGRVVGVQPRIRLTRSFDERQHSYLGYVLRLDGGIDGEGGPFSVGIGKAAHVQHAFRAGDLVAGLGVGPGDPQVEAVDLYRVSALRLLERAEGGGGAPPPWTHVAPALEIYRARGHRRLGAATYSASCQACTWGCEMPVEMIVDPWNPTKHHYRRETFCYGPKSCSIYRPGPTRKVPGRKGMSYEEADWVDEDATAHRGPEE